MLRRDSVTASRSNPGGSNRVQHEYRLYAGGQAGRLRQVSNPPVSSEVGNRQRSKIATAETGVLKTGSRLLETTRKTRRLEVTIRQSRNKLV